MRQLKLLTLLLASVLFLFACGAEDTEDTAATESEVAEAVEEEEESWQREGDDEHRVIATTVALAEIMEQLEVELVGIPTTYKDLHPKYKDLTEVGIADDPDMEIVRSLDPTDVLSVTTLQADVEDYYEQTETPVSFYDLESYDGMLKSIQQLGEEYNRVEEAEALVKEFEDNLADIQAEIADKESPSVLILLGIPGSYLVATENSYLGDIVKLAGGENVFPDAGDGIEYTSANTEHLQQTNPDVILRAAHGMPEAVVEMFDKEFAENDVWKHFDAVENDRVYDLEEELFGTTANLAAHDALLHLLDILYEE